MAAVLEPELHKELSPATTECEDSPHVTLVPTPDGDEGRHAVPASAIVQLLGDHHAELIMSATPNSRRTTNHWLNHQLHLLAP